MPTPEVIGGVGVGGAGDFLVQPPDPRVDRANVDRAEKFIAERCVPLLEEAKAPYRVEILVGSEERGGEGCRAAVSVPRSHTPSSHPQHFGTDADSVGQLVAARAAATDAAAVVLTKHDAGALKRFFLGSTAKYLTKHCDKPVVVLQG